MAKRGPENLEMPGYGIVERLNQWARSFQLILTNL